MAENNTQPLTTLFAHSSDMCGSPPPRRAPFRAAVHYPPWRGIHISFASHSRHSHYTPQHNGEREEADRQAAFLWLDMNTR